MSGEEKKAAHIAALAEDSEKATEQALMRAAKERGGLCLKMNSMSGAGWPDRLVILPGGATAWVELKSRGEKLRALQVARMLKLIDLGQRAAVIDNPEAARYFVERLAEGKV